MRACWRTGLAPIGGTERGALVACAQVKEHICKLARKGMTPSQIGVVLRDSHGIPQVASVTGSKVLRILKGSGLAPDIPEDLYHLIKKAVSMRKHMERSRKDKDGKFRLILIESRIHRLARYYKVRCRASPAGSRWLDAGQKGSVQSRRRARAHQAAPRMAGCRTEAGCAALCMAMHAARCRRHLFPAAAGPALVRKLQQLCIFGFCSRMVRSSLHNTLVALPSHACPPSPALLPAHCSGPASSRPPSSMSLPLPPPWWPKQ